jgi:plastocyanin
VLVVVLAVTGIAPSPAVRAAGTEVQTAPEAQTAPEPPAAPAEVTLTADGFAPDVLTVAAGRTVIFTNATPSTRTVRTDDETFDSGPLAPGERFAVAVAATGVLTVGDDATPAHTMTLRLASGSLAGDPSLPARDAVPDLFPPPAVRVMHPDLATSVAQTRVLVTFNPSATVAQANAALAAAGVSVVGGFRTFGIVVGEVAASDVPADVAPLEAALASLRSDPAIAAASMDITLDVTADVPRPVAPQPVAAEPYDWDGGWDDTVDQPTATGGNWGLEASRFPQAWNLLDPIGAAGAPGPVDVAVLDAGFAPHPDTLATVQLERYCAAGGTPCTENRAITDDLVNHGLAVSAIVGAEWDRGAPSSATSEGTVGGAPNAEVHGVPLTMPDDALRDPSGSVVRAAGANSVPSFLGTISAVLAQRQGAPPDLPHLKVINISGGGLDFSHVPA